MIVTHEKNICARYFRKVPKHLHVQRVAKSDRRVVLPQLLNDLTAVSSARF